MFMDLPRFLGCAGALIVEDLTIVGNSLGLDWDATRGGEGAAYGHWNVNGIWCGTNF
jgi:hypothetical protein